MCSIKECGKEIVGVGVLLADEFEAGIKWREGGFLPYTGIKDDGKETEYIIIHPVCFIDLFNEFTRQQSQTALMIMVAHTGDLREALAIPL